MNWLRRNRSKVVLWSIVLAVLVVAQSPMLRGMGYRLFGVALSDDGIPWRTDFKSALAESKQTGKPVLLRFSGAWCPPCQAMKLDVWPDLRVSKAVTEGYIPVAVDDDVPANEEVAARYGVISIPRIIIIDAAGNVLREGGYMSADAMAAFLAKTPM